MLAERGIKDGSAATPEEDFSKMPPEGPGTSLIISVFCPCD
jgi:hypothetical protein